MADQTDFCMACMNCDWTSCDPAAQHECPNNPAHLRAQLRAAETLAKEYRSNWIAEEAKRIRAEEAKERAEALLADRLECHKVEGCGVCASCLNTALRIAQNRATAAEGALREAREENGRIRKAYSALRDSYQGVLDFARDVHAIVSGKVQRTGMVRASPAVVARLIASDAVPTLDDVLARDKRAQPPPPETP
jgi:hypothetical protein